MPRQFKQNALEQVLKTLCRQGGFKAAAVASAAGLLVASAGAEVEMMAAVAAHLPALVGRLPHLDPLDEIMIQGQTGYRLVCRYFISRGDALILIVLSPADRTYRRRVSGAVRQVQTVWEQPPISDRLPR